MTNEFFYCDTPYQIFTAINIVLGRKSNSLYSIAVYHQFSQSHELSSKLKSSGLFIKVYDLFPAKSSWKDFQRLIFSKKYVRNEIGITSKYDKVHFACLDTSASLALYSSLSFQEAVLFEDGTVSYRESGINGYMSWKRLALLHLFHPRVRYFAFSEFMLFAPDMCLTNEIPYKSRISVSHSSFLFDLFSYKKNDAYCRRKVVFLDQPYPIHVRQMHDIYLKEHLCSISDQVIIRPHPRMQSSSITCGEIDRYTNNWELECIQQISNDHILISIYSTAMFQPMIVANKAPTLIFLYKLYVGLYCEEDLKEIDCHLCRFMEAFKHIEVLIPTCWHELAERLECL